MNNSNQQNTVENLGRRGFVVSGAAALFAGLVGPQILGCRNSVAQNFEEPAANSPKKGAEAAKSGFEALSEEEVKALCSEDLIVRKFSKKGNARFGTLDGEKINRRAVKAQEVMGEDFWRYRKDDGDYLAHVPESLEKGEALRFERVLKMNIKFDDDGGFKPVGIVDFAGHRLRRKKHYKTEWIQKNGKNYFALIIKDQTFICPVAFEDLDKKDQEISLIHDYEIIQEKPTSLQGMEDKFAEIEHIEVPFDSEIEFDEDMKKMTPESIAIIKALVEKYRGIKPKRLKVSQSIKPRSQWILPRPSECKSEISDDPKRYAMIVKKGREWVAQVNWEECSDSEPVKLRLHASMDAKFDTPLCSVYFAPVSSANGKRKFRFSRLSLRSFSDEGSEWYLEPTENGRKEAYVNYNPLGDDEPMDTELTISRATELYYDESGEMVRAVFTQDGRSQEIWRKTR